MTQVAVGSDEGRVAAQQASATLKAPRIIEINQNVRLTGSLGRPGARNVVLQVRDQYDKWRTVARTRSSSSGRFAFEKVLARPPANPAPILTIRALAPRTGGRPSVSTPSRTVRSVYPRPDMTGPLSIVSVSSDERLGDEGSGDNGFDVSDDGRFTVFASGASWDDPNQTRRGLQVFLRDRRGTTTLVSRARDGRPAKAYSFVPLISGNGRWVVYSSAAPNLVPDQPRRGGLYWWDRTTGRTSLVTGIPPGYPLALSRTGRFLAFASSTPDLPPSPADDAWDLYILDRETGIADQVETPATSLGYSIEEMFAVSMSNDGRYVAYAVDVADRSPHSDPNNRELRFTDRVLGTTKVIPVDPFDQRTALEDLDITDTSMSADGRLVAYTARIESPDLYLPDRAAVVWDSETGEVDVVAQPRLTYAPSETSGPRVADISADGRYVAYLSLDVLEEQVYRVDRTTDAIDVVVPDPPVGPPDGWDPFYSAPLLSGDGSTVVFTIDSLLKEYVPGDINRRVDVFAWEAPPPG